MIRTFIIEFILIAGFVIATVIAAGAAEQEKGGILMLAPCFTDKCVETQSESIWFFEHMGSCVDAASDFNEHGLDSWAWCAEPMEINA